jgi:hypothetical protein
MHLFAYLDISTHRGDTDKLQISTNLSFRIELKFALAESALLICKQCKLLVLASKIKSQHDSQFRKKNEWIIIDDDENSKQLVHSLKYLDSNSKISKFQIELLKFLPNLFPKSFRNNLLPNFENEVDINYDCKFYIEGDKIFLGHKSFLSLRSDYFAALLSGSFKEGMNSNPINIPEISEQAFAIIMEYIYTGNLL